MCNYALRMTEAREAAGLYQQGLSMRQIAERFSVSQQAVKSVLDLLEVPRRDKVEARRLRSRPPPATHHITFDRATKILSAVPLREENQQQQGGA